MSHKALSLSTVEKFVPLAARKGVSEVARSSRGFVQAYRRAGGKLSAMSPEWQAKREGFIARHMAQVSGRSEDLFDAKGLPSRRHLALIMWAYSPAPGKLKSVPQENPVISGRHPDLFQTERWPDGVIKKHTDIVFAGGDWRKHSVPEIESSWDTMTSAELYEIIEDSDDYDAGRVDIEMLRAKGYSEELLRDVKKGDFSNLATEINDWFLDVYARLAKALDTKAEETVSDASPDNYKDYVDDESIVDEAKEIAENEFGWVLTRQAIREKVDDIRENALEMDTDTGGFWDTTVDLYFEELDEAVFDAADIYTPGDAGRNPVSASDLQLDEGDWEQVSNACAVAKLDMKSLSTQFKNNKDPKARRSIPCTVPFVIHARMDRSELHDILEDLAALLADDEDDVPRPQKGTYMSKSDEAFWSWFGNSVVVVDDEGNPKVCFHGTRKGGFTVFSKSKIDAHHAGFFFSSKLAVSRTYTDSSDEPIKRGLPPESRVDAQYPQPGIYRVFLRIENPLVVDAAGAQWNHIRFEEDPVPCEAAFDELLRLYENYAEYDKGSGIRYACAIAQNVPVIAAARRVLWEQMTGEYEPPPLLDTKDQPGLAYEVVRQFVEEWKKTRGSLWASLPWWPGEKLEHIVLAKVILKFFPRRVYDVEAYPNLAKACENLDSEGNPGISGENIVKSQRTKTDKLAHIAKNRGHDGLIVKNVHDSGDSTGLDPEGTVYVVFDPTQVKSVHNVGTWSREDPDIRRNPRSRR